MQKGFAYQNAEVGLRSRIVQCLAVLLSMEGDDYIDAAACERDRGASTPVIRATLFVARVIC